MTRLVDVTELPEELVALIDALGPGEDLVIVRDEEPLATISPARGGLDDPEEPGERPEPDDYGNVTVVATAMKLSASARTALSTELGGDYIVLDLRSAPATADVVLVPPASPQLVGALRSSFPTARIVVTEIEDRELGVSYQGPVRRLLDAGAENYLAATTIPRLARQLATTVERTQLDAAPAQHLAIAAPTE